MKKTSRAVRQIFAANLRRERKKCGLSQETLADIAGLHRTYVGSVERGERNISLDNVERLARALGLEPADLLRKLPNAKTVKKSSAKRRGLS
jgi:transcriptional regulator with XRE-family HTH domain